MLYAQNDSQKFPTSVGALVREVFAVHEEGAVEAAPKHRLRMHEVHCIRCKAAAHELEDRAWPRNWQQQNEAQQGRCNSLGASLRSCPPCSGSAVRHVPSRATVLRSEGDDRLAQWTFWICKGLADWRTQIVSVLAGTCYRSELGNPNHKPLNHSRISRITSVQSSTSGEAVKSSVLGVSQLKDSVFNGLHDHPFQYLQINGKTHNATLC